MTRGQPRPGTIVPMATTRPAPTAVRRMRPATRKAVLIVHIVASGGWLGIDAILAVLVFTGRSADTTTAALSYQALGTFLMWPLLVASVLSLLSGVVMGLGTKYGLLRYRWVTVKLALNLILTALVVLTLAPSLPEVAEYGRLLASGAPPTDAVDSLIYPAIVSPAALSVAMVLSVAKPWGRTRRAGTT